MSEQQAPFDMNDVSGSGLQARVPPQATDVERSILGAMLTGGTEIASTVISLLSTEAFYKPAHRKVFEAITALYQRNDVIDLITVTEELRRREQIDSTLNPFFLSEMASNVVSTAHIERHCRIVLERALKRQLITTNVAITDECYQDATDAFEIIDKAETELFKLSERHMKKSYVQLNEIVDPLMKDILAISQKHSGVTGVPSGYGMLDAKTGGWQRSDFIILAARPSMGKTALALSMARNASIDHNIPVGFFSLEMSKEQLALRLLCAEARLSMQLVRTGRIRESDYARLATYVGKLEHAKIFIDDTPGMSILELRAKSRRMVEERGVQIILIDYLQLMTAPGIKESREREIATISRSLKGLAKDLNIPVIALSQLNRSVETRAGNKPMLADLRESGSLEQDADVVLFVHRNKDGEGAPEDDQNQALLIIGKQRNGETGEVPLAWIGEYARFENLEMHMPNVMIPPGFDEVPI
jgi:replicative DNA helicase